MGFSINLCGGKPLPYWLHVAVCRELAALGYPELPEPDWQRWNVMQALLDQGRTQAEAKQEAGPILRRMGLAEVGADAILGSYKKINRRLGLQRRWQRKG